MTGNLTLCLKLLRLNRTLMVALVAGSGAWVGMADPATCWLVALAGWFLAAGGFTLDFLADRQIDATGPRAQSGHNPFAGNGLPPAAGVIFAIVSIALSAAILAFLPSEAFLFWALILVVCFLLGIRFFASPFMRGLSLGLLQALYFMMGAATGTVTLGTGLLAGFFLLAMFGGKVVTDIRDYDQDEATSVATYPRRFGIRAASWITVAALLTSYALTLAAYFTGEFSPVYLYLDIVFIALGIAAAAVFVFKPTPRVARVMVYVFMVGLGSLLCLAMILGKVRA